MFAARFLWGRKQLLVQEFASAYAIDCSNANFAKIFIVFNWPLKGHTAVANARLDYFVFDFIFHNCLCPHDPYSCIERQFCA